MASTSKEPASSINQSSSYQTNTEQKDISDDPYYSFTPPKLWLIDNRFTNYVVWRAHVHDMFKRDGLFGFIDGTNTPPSETVIRSRTSNEDDDNEGVLMENPDYHIWKMSAECAKERLLSLIDKDIVPSDHEHKTCRDICLHLRDRFRRLVPPSRLSYEGGSRSGEYMKLYEAALHGDLWAKKNLLFSDVGEMVRNNVIAWPIYTQNPFIQDHQVVGGGTHHVFPQHTEPIYAQDDHWDDQFLGGTPFCVTARLALLISAIDAGNFFSALIYLNTLPHMTGPDLSGLKLSNKSALTCLASNHIMFGCRKADNKDDLLPQAVPFTGVNAILNFMLKLMLEYILEALVALNNRTLLCTVIFSFGTIVFICCIPLILLNTVYWLPWKFLTTVGFVEKKPKEKPRDPHAIILLDHVCESMKSLPATSKEIFGEAFLLAARSGAHVVTEKILTYFPEGVFYRNHISSQYTIHMAVESRDQDLFAILYKELRVDNFMRLPLHIPDGNGNNILHLAAKLSPPNVLDKIPGPVLQIQHELKWFKEIEKIMSPHDQVKLSRDRKTPKMIFAEEHKDLKDKAEKWMKDTATSCTVIAALIGTIMFAAAITVPGGSNQNTVFPMFGQNFTFTLFAVSDAISFITSVISLLMFMEIMMARYDVGDFMLQLPVRLFIGLGSLFVSIFFMILSFSVAVYLVFGQPHHWVLISMVTITCYVVLLFGYLQGSLLFEMIGSTYSGGFIPPHQVKKPVTPQQNSNDHLGEDPLSIV